MEIWIAQDGRVARVHGGAMSPPAATHVPSPARGAWQGRVVILVEDGVVRGAHHEAGEVRMIDMGGDQPAMQWDGHLRPPQPLDDAALEEIFGRRISIRPPAPTSDMVRAEAQRRMMRLLGARSPEHLQVLISNGLRRGMELLRKRLDPAQGLTPEEEAEAQRLERMNAAIDAIRAASDSLEAMNPIPADFAADGHWPSLPGAGVPEGGQ